MVSAAKLTNYFQTAQITQTPVPKGELSVVIHYNK